MTYVREQTSAELAAHMRSLQKMAGWFDPLSDRLWQEVEALKAENERLKTLRSVTERDLAQELEVWRHGPSCWNCGDTGDVHDIVGEWRGQCDCNAAKLIDVAAERDQLKAENEALRKDSERLQSATAFVQKLCDAAVKQPSVATGYLHDILSAMGKEEQS